MAGDPAVLTADPWGGPVAPTRRRAVWAWSVLAVVLGASGVLGRLWQLGPNARRAALVLAVAVVLWELLLRAGTYRNPVRAGLLVVLAAAEVLSASSGGRAPALLVLGSLTVADAALVDWRPARRWPRRATAVAGLAVPLLVVAQVSWYRSGAVVVFVVLLVLALAVVETYHRRPAAVAPLDRGLARALAALAELVGTLAVLVVALPVYLAGLLGRALGRGPATGRRRSPSAWRDVPPTPTTDAAVPFSSPPPSVRRRRHLGALGMVLVTALVVGAGVVAVRSWPGSSSPVPPTAPVPTPLTLPPSTTTPNALDLLAAVPYSDRGAFRGDDWADQLQEDQAEVALVPDPVTGWRNAPSTRTGLVNVRQGRRVSPGASCPGCPRATVWLVGASAAFGIGQRDQGTVAATLQRRAAADGVALDVVNLGVPGWTAHQEVEDALRRLRSSGRKPDAVVVLDGFNDVTAATAREVLGRGDDPSPLVFEERGVQQALSSGTLTAAQVDRVVARASSALRTEHGRLAAALEQEGVPLYRFFQPDAFASRRQLAAVRSLYEVLPGLVERQELGDALARTAAALTNDSVDLREVFDGQRQVVLLDIVHTNEEGASVVADRVYAQLLPTLRSATGRP